MKKNSNQTDLNYLAMTIGSAFIDYFEGRQKIMAKVEARRCDRCGELFVVDIYPKVKVQLPIKTSDPNTTAGYDFVDLCNKCQDIIMDALNYENPYQKLIKDLEEI